MYDVPRNRELIHFSYDGKNSISGNRSTSFDVVIGASLTDDNVRSYRQGRITHFMVPTRICFVDEYPMTVTAKIQKFKMSEFMAGELSHAA